MRIVSKNPVIVAGLTGVLALGVAGCSFSSESSSTTTVETSVTDEEGNTTTTTESTTVSTGGSTQEAEETADGQKYYENEYYGIRFTLPEGFESSKVESEVEGESIDYFASDTSGDNSIQFVLVQGVTEIEGITDQDSWAEAWGAALEETLAEDGETDIKAGTGTGTIGNLETGAVSIDSTTNEGTIHRESYFIVDEDGDGLRITLTATDESVLNEMQSNLQHVEA